MCSTFSAWSDFSHFSKNMVCYNGYHSLSWIKISSRFLFCIKSYIDSTIQILEIICLRLRGGKSIMIKWCFFDVFWAQNIVCDSHNSIDSIGSIDCIDSIASIESEDSTDSIDSLDFIDTIDSILVPHKRPPTFTPHTKGRSIVPMRTAPSAPPPLVVSFSFCLWCGCWRSFVCHVCVC